MIKQNISQVNLLPFELHSINNSELLEQYKSDYNEYLFYIDDEVIPSNENYTHRILLNKENDYLFILSNDMIEIIAAYDCLARKYLNCERVFHITFSDGEWKCHRLIDKVKQCDKCCDYYYDKCFCDNKEIKNDICKRYIMLPITNNTSECHILIYVNGVLIHEFDIELANKKVDWWSVIDMEKYVGRKIKIIAEDLVNMSGFNAIYTSDEKKYQNKDDSLRPQLRFSQPFGWINDPNGLVYHNGLYHLFYQHNPFSINWNNMYWGHAVSKDLIHWEHWPLALYPYTMASGQCFSGSAYADNDRMIIVFTDTNKGECMAESFDGGYSWKCIEDPLIRHIGRDPKLIRYENHWVIVVYEKYGDSDTFAFYKSYDLIKWDLVSRLEGFYECPELIKLGNKWVIFGSDGKYMIGDFDGETFVPMDNKKHQLFHGLFQASQCFNNMDGRVAQIGWVPINIENMSFNQAFSLPLELTLSNDGMRMLANPVKEFEVLRKGKQVVVDYEFDGCYQFDVNGSLFDVLIDVNMDDITIIFGNDMVKYENVNKIRIIIDIPVFDIIVNDGVVYDVRKRETVEDIQFVKIEGKGKINEFAVYELDSVGCPAP